MQEKTPKYYLGIETSCDDTSVCILKQESNQQVKIITHKTFGQEDILKEWGGVVPEIAARSHLEKILPLLDYSFKKAEISPKDLECIGVTASPGLLGPLLTGVNAAKSLSLLNKTPIVPVNHLLAHLEAVHITEKVSYPYLGLLVSGGHSLYVLMKSCTDFEIIGGTIDDAAGEAFDKGGKMLGLGYPAGHIIDKLSKWGDQSSHKFPIGMQSSKNAQLSFSGLKTALRVYIETKNIQTDIDPLSALDQQEKYQYLYDICASYQKAIVDSLLLKLRYAISACQEKGYKNLPIVVGGGVACNSELRAKIKEKYTTSYFVKPEFCTDNGAMIAHYAYLNHKNAINYPESLKIDATSRFIKKGSLSHV